MKFSEKVEKLIDELVGRDRFDDYVSRYRSGREIPTRYYDDFPEVLWRSFEWGDTPEGSGFWSTLYENKIPYDTLKKQRVDLISSFTGIRRSLYEAITTRHHIDIKIEEGVKFSGNVRCLAKNQGGSWLQLKDIQAPKFGNWFDIRENKIVFDKDYKSGIDKTQRPTHGLNDVLAKPSKLVNHIVQNALLDSDVVIPEKHIEKVKRRLVELISSDLNMLGKVDIQITDDVKGTYNTPTSEESTGSLTNSCMRPESKHGCKSHADFYTGIARIAHYKKQGRLLARALIWDINIDDIGEATLVDRIYGTEDAIAAFKKWAEDNDFAYKQRQSHEAPTIIYKGSAYDRYHHVLKKEIQFGKIRAPYLDTLWRSDGKNLYPDVYYYQDHKIELRNTEGGVTIRDADTCPECGTVIENREDANELNGDYYCEDCVEWCDYIDENHPASDTVYLDYRNGYYRCDDVRTTTNGNEYWYEDEGSEFLELYNGEFVDYEDGVKDDYNDYYIHIDNAAELSDGTYIHQDEVITLEDTGETVSPDYPYQEIDDLYYSTNYEPLID